MTEILTVSAPELRPFDAITEGSMISSILFHEVERRDPATGAVTRRRVVTVTSTPAQYVGEEFEGGHLHRPSTQPADERTFEWDEVVQVARPAPMAPCGCGFRGAS